MNPHLDKSAIFTQPFVRVLERPNVTHAYSNPPAIGAPEAVGGVAVSEAGDARRGRREGQRVRAPQQRRRRRERGAVVKGRFDGKTKSDNGKLKGRDHSDSGISNTDRAREVLRVCPYPKADGQANGI